MAHHRGPKTITQDLIFHYDTGNGKSFAGEPTTNYIPQTYDYSLYAYASGPVDTTAYNEYNTPVSVKRYTITNAINTARAAIFPSTTTGVFYTFSFKWKYNGTVTSSPSIAVSAFKGNPETNNNSFTSETSNTISIGNGWYLTTYIFNFSSNPTGGCILTFGISTGSNTAYVNETFDIYQAQFEIKNHRTQYTLGTRSNTQGLIDLSRNRTISISGVSFDSNAMMLFDGTDDAIPITTPPNFSGSGSWTMNTWFKINGAPSSTAYMNVIVDMDPTGGSANMICVNWSDMMLQYRSRPVGGSYTTINGSVLSQNVWYNATAVKYGTNETKLFLNGVQDGGTYSGNLPAGNQSFFNIGRWTDGTVYANATIPIVSIYNRALTPDEVYRNYMSLKSRFGL
jgi:hypothetical protein